MKLKCIDDHDLNRIDYFPRKFSKLECLECPKINNSYHLWLFNEELVFYHIRYESYQISSGDRHSGGSWKNETGIINYSNKSKNTPLIFSGFTQFNIKKPKSIIEIIKKTLELKQFL
jgi:hypothetical protein